jgi:hypothetical protein
MISCGSSPFKPESIELFNNTLDPERTTELREKMLRAGLPI